jgi:hypothetical protein
VIAVFVVSNVSHSMDRTRKHADKTDYTKVLCVKVDSS